MPVEVSYLKSNSTDNGTGWTNHTHSLSVEDHTVPTIGEFRGLEKRIENCRESIAEMENDIAETRRCVDDCLTSVMDAKKRSDAAAKKISVFAASLSDMGKLATVFKNIVETNLAKIQHENDVMARSVKRLIELGIIRSDDRVVVDKPITRRKSCGGANGVKKTKASRATISRKSIKNARM